MAVRARTATAAPTPNSFFNLILSLLPFGISFLFSSFFRKRKERDEHRPERRMPRKDRLCWASLMMAILELALPPDAAGAPAGLTSVRRFKQFYMCGTAREEEKVNSDRLELEDERAPTRGERRDRTRAGGGLQESALRRQRLGSCRAITPDTIMFSNYDAPDDDAAEGPMLPQVQPESEGPRRCAESP